MRDVILSLRTFDQYVVDVDFHRDSQQLREDLVHQPLICRPYILQTDKHDFVTIKSTIGDECNVFLISVDHGDLVVPEYASMKLRSSRPAVASTIWSIRGT